MNVLFVLAVELYVHVWLCVWVYTHIYMLLKMSIRKDIFNLEHFFPLPSLSINRIAIEGKKKKKDFFKNVFFPVAS